MNGFENRLKEDLRLSINQNSFKEVSLFRNYVDFYSNDYLGLSQIEINSSDKTSGSYRVIRGTSIEQLRLERKLKTFFEAETALCFNSGYAANLGVISALCRKSDVILYDDECHASLQDGIKLSFSKAYPYKHNSIEDLERLLKLYGTKNTFIITEGLFSTLGDFPLLDEILYLAEKYKAKLILDEAHSAGLFGHRGIGVISNYSNTRIIAKIITFGKAFGSHGAAVLCSKRVKDYLINFSKPFIYTTALPVSIIKKTDTVLNEEILSVAQHKLQNNILEFNRLIDGIDLVSHDNSPIKTVMFNDAKALKKAENQLQSEGLGVKAMFPSTDSEGKNYLRIILHSFNTTSEIKHLTGLLLSYRPFIKNYVAKT